MDKNLIMLEAKKELARREFFYFCHLSAPSFYKTDRKFLVRLCNEMQSFYESDEDALIINLPPRHGKSRTASMFVEWVLGRNQSEKIMTGSYNETLSTTFSKTVRNAIQEEKADEEKIASTGRHSGNCLLPGTGYADGRKHTHLQCILL